ncbi:MAG: hypothetical protein ACI9H8_002153 [Lysobacterales bacterium]|jgi:hypothetical protein
MTLLVILTSMLQLAGIDSVNHTCGQNAHAQKLASLIMGHESQQRPVLQCNELLAKIADQRALELINGSKPDDLTPNQILTKNGFKFASFYPPKGNQVEAVAVEWETPESALDYLTRNNKHRDLVLGNGEFFSRQTQIGVGYHKNELNETQYVVLIAEAWTKTKIIIKQTFEAPTITTETECGKTWRSSKNDDLRKACRERFLKKKDGD